MKVLIADKSIIAIEGLKAIINRYSQFRIEGTVLESIDLESALKKDSTDKVIIFDPVILGLKPETIQSWIKSFPKAKWLAISQNIYHLEIKKYLNAGVLGFLLKECDEQEIVESIG
jgi:DNA-binding NarL/FixJ family response regulator